MSSEEIVGGKSVFLYLKGEDVLGGITQFFPYTKTLKSSTDSESTWKSPGIFPGPMGRNLVVEFKTNSKVTHVQFSIIPFPIISKLTWKGFRKEP